MSFFSFVSFSFSLFSGQYIRVFVVFILISQADTTRFFFLFFFSHRRLTQHNISRYITEEPSDYRGTEKNREEPSDYIGTQRLQKRNPAITEKPRRTQRLQRNLAIAEEPSDYTGTQRLQRNPAITEELRGTQRLQRNLAITEEPNDYKGTKR